MTWTAPRTWTTGELVTKTIMDTHVRDNLLALKDPPSDNYEPNEGADYTTTSGTLTNVDGTNLSLTITTTGGDIMVGFIGSVITSSSGIVTFDVTLDGTPQAGDNGICAALGANIKPTGFVYLIIDPSAASHTINLQWRINTGTATLYAGAGTANRDVHGQFWIREVT